MTFRCSMDDEEEHHAAHPAEPEVFDIEKQVGYARKEKQPKSVQRNGYEA